MRGVSNPPITNTKSVDMQKPPIDPNNQSGTKPSVIGTPTHSTPRAGSQLNSSMSQLQPFTKSQTQTSIMQANPEKIEKGDLSNRLEMSDRNGNLFQDDDNLLVTPEKAEFYDNQESSILSTPNGNSSSNLLDRSVDSKTNVKVVIRVRPMSERELGK